MKGSDELAALTLMLPSFSFWIAVLFTTGAPQWVLSLLIIIGLISLAVYVVSTTKDDVGVNTKKVSD